MILIRVGTLFIVSGILVGLFFSDWFPILFTGVLLIVFELVRRLVETHANKADVRPEATPLLQPSQEEI